MPTRNRRQRSKGAKAQGDVRGPGTHSSAGRSFPVVSSPAKIEIKSPITSTALEGETKGEPKGKWIGDDSEGSPGKKPKRGPTQNRPSGLTPMNWHMNPLQTALRSLLVNLVMMEGSP
jgi:hypothetical protein